MRTRRPTDADWPTILALADVALPQAPDGNNAWLDARRAFSVSSRSGVQHLFLDDGEGVLAFGAVEQMGTLRFRLFLVTRPDQLDLIGDEVLSVLAAEAVDLGADKLWMREHADDPLVEFARKRGFQELLRYQLGPEHGAYAGVDVVELERPCV